jgi:hypothetical protein
LIALPIACVAIENARIGALHAWRPVVAFGLGLMRGMGFAGVLQQIGKPRSEFRARWCRSRHRRPSNSMTASMP